MTAPDSTVTVKKQVHANSAKELYHIHNKCRPIYAFNVNGLGQNNVHCYVIKHLTKYEKEKQITICSVQ